MTLKRLLDVFLGSVLLVAAIPVLVLAALLICLDSAGSPLFKQERIGRFGKPFVLYKLRTMHAGAHDLREHLWMRCADDPFFKLSNDPRITRIGNFLRVTSIDELPQLWNVVKGDMSLVGPRPVTVEEVTEDPRFATRAIVAPGLTGLWQVKARRDPRLWVSRLHLDVEYVGKRSTRLDLALLFATVAVIGKGR